jgi:hypothetical protein
MGLKPTTKMINFEQYITKLIQEQIINPYNNSGYNFDQDIDQVHRDLLVGYINSPIDKVLVLSKETLQYILEFINLALYDFLKNFDFKKNTKQKDKVKFEIDINTYCYRYSIDKFSLLKNLQNFELSLFHKSYLIGFGGRISPQEILDKIASLSTK